MREWVEKYKGPKGFVDRRFLQDMALEDGVKPQALVEEPSLLHEYHYIVDAHAALKTEGLIPFTEMQAWLCDYPEVEPRRFKALLRAYDRESHYGN